MDEDTVKKIISAHDMGMSIRAIAKNLGIGKSTIARVIQKNVVVHSERPQKDVPEEIKIPQGATMDQKITDNGIEGYQKGASKFLSEKLLKDYTVSLKVAEVMRGAEMRFRAGVESMGENWEDFILQSIEHGYDALKEDVKTLDAINMLTQYVELVKLRDEGKTIDEPSREILEAGDEAFQNVAKAIKEKKGEQYSSSNMLQSMMQMAMIKSLSRM